MSSVTPVIVGVDGSQSSVEAAYIAADEAAARDVTLILVHVGPADDWVFESAVRRVRRWHPDIELSTHHYVDLTAGPAQALAAKAAEADACLLVVGHRRPSAGHGVVPRSVAQRLLDCATVPVLVNRAVDLTCCVPEPRPVLVGVGPHGSPDAVMEFGWSEALRWGAPLNVLCAVPDYPSDDAAGRPDPEVVESVQRWFDRDPDVSGRLHVRHGIDPAIALMVDSHTAQLVVVGSSSHRTAAASVAHALVHRAACPVAVVPTMVHSGRYLEPSAQAV